MRPPSLFATAAYLVRAAAEQGVAQAQRLIEHLGESSSEPPLCLRPPAPVASNTSADQEATVLPPVPIVTSAPKGIAKRVESIAPQYQVHPQLALLMMKAESVAAYNAGEGTVDRYLGVPPYRETRHYVRRILDGFGRDAPPFDARVTRPSARLRRIRALLATR